MDQKELKIEIPEGYEIDKENSTFEKIVFKKKPLDYNQIVKELSHEYTTFTAFAGYACFPKQSSKIEAISKLLNVAKYLNGDWKPDWNNREQRKYEICIKEPGKCIIAHSFYVNDSIVYFKSGELAKQAIEILGEETIRQALNTDY